MLSLVRRAAVGRHSASSSSALAIAATRLDPSSTTTSQALLQQRQFSESTEPMRKQTVKKQKQAPVVQEEPTESRHFKLVKACLDTKPVGAPPAAEEELERRARIGNAYVVGKFEEHNEINHDLNCKIRLKQHAIKLLPKNLRQSALAVDDEGPPTWRHIPVWTAPIPGFDPTEFMEED